MQKGLIGKKIGMTQIFDDNGNVIPVTVVEAGPCTVVQKKTVENDGYEAVQVGFGEVKISRVNKPQAGHFKKADVAPKKVLKEFRLADTSALTSATSSRLTYSQSATELTLSAQAKVRAPLVPSRDGTSHALKKLTVRVLLQDMPVHSVLAPILQEYSRARSLPVISARRELRFRILTS